MSKDINEDKDKFKEKMKNIGNMINDFGESDSILSRITISIIAGLVICFVVWIVGIVIIALINTSITVCLISIVCIICVLIEFSDDFK